VAPARHRPLPCLRRGGVSARVAAGAGTVCVTACVHVRPGAGDRRGSGAPAVAGPGGPDAAALVRDGRGRVLRDVLLCVRHALLSGPGAVGPRRPDADAARAGAVLVLAEV